MTTVRTKKLSEFCGIATGGTPSRENLHRYFGGSIPWVKSGELEDGPINGTEETLTDLGFQNSNARYFPKNTVLVALYGATVGKTAILEIEATTNQAVAGIVPDKDIADYKYIFHFLRSYAPKLMAARVGGAQPNISQGILRDIDVPLPPLPIQKQIAAILEKADAAREKRRKANQLTEQFLQSAFLEMFGDPGVNPMGWPAKRLAELVRDDDKVNYGVVQPGDDYPGGVAIVRVGDMKEMRVDQSCMKRIHPKIESAYKRSRLVGHEVLLACVGSIGMVALADPSLQGFNTVRAVARIRCGPDLHRLYLAYYLSTSFAQSFFTRETRTVSQPTLNIRQIEETKILVPPLSEQKKFAALVEKVESLRVKQRESEKELENLFNSLMQRAFRGELVQ